MKLHLTILISLFCLCASAQEIHDVKVLAQQNMAAWGVRGANYSGIAYLGDNRYALVSDKEPKDGFYPFTILLDSVSGKVKEISPAPMVGVFANASDTTAISGRDQEGIAYVPQTGTLIISGEGDQRIIEHRTDGTMTGRALKIPQKMGTQAIYPNYGFEALTYSAADGGLFWTVTEHTLKADGRESDYYNPAACLLRLQSFSTSLKPARQYAYRMDAPRVGKPSKAYAYGVTALTALDDGTLLVLEREFYVAPDYIGSWVRNKIYRVDPSAATPVTFKTDLATCDDSVFLPKTLIAEFKTSLNPISRSLANYEGMCLGPVLPDGRHTLLLVSDSQNNYGNSIYKMKEYIRVITFLTGDSLK